MGHEGDGPLGGHPGGEGGVEGTDGVYDSQAVGTDEAHLVSFGDVHYLTLPLNPLSARLAEAGADNDDPLNPFLAAFLQHRGHELGRNNHDGQVNGPWNIEDARVTLEAQDLVGFGVNGIDLARVTVFDEIGQDSVAELLLGAGGPDHGHGSGIEERF